MREVLDRLLELQELETVVDESTILHGGKQEAKASRIRKRIEALRRDVNPAVLRRYDQVRGRGITAVSREIEGVCNACRLNVPRGDLNRMQRGVMEWMCPNCGRFLYLSAGQQ